MPSRLVKFIRAAAFFLPLLSPAAGLAQTRAAAPAEMIADVKFTAEGMDLQADSPVTDSGTTLEYGIFHAHSLSGRDPMLGKLIRGFRRGDSNGQIRWIVIVNDRAHADDIYGQLKDQGLNDLSAQVRFVEAPGSTNTWARDVYAVFHGADTGAYGLKALLPVVDEGGEGTLRHLVSADLKWDAAFHYGTVESRPSLRELPAAGGDLAADDAFVYTSRNSIKRMVEEAGFESEETARGFLRDLFNRQVLVLAGADTHLDRYHMPLGPIDGVRTNLLADPAAAAEIISGLSEEERREAVQTFVRAYWKDGESKRGELEAFFRMNAKDAAAVRESDYAKALDTVARELKQNGIRVVRIPGLPKRIFHDKPFPLGIYYTNLVQDTYRDAAGRTKRRLVLPVYGISALDRRVMDTLQDLDAFEITAIPAQHEGNLSAGIRCLMQTAGRSYK